MARRVFVGRGTGRRLPSSLRRKTLWISSADITAPIPLVGAASVLDQFLSEAFVATTGPFTIVRTVGSISVASDQEIADENVLLGLGACVVSEQARAVGVTAVPTPITDEGSELFFLYETVVQSVRFSDATGVHAPWFVTKYFDSRAQRKVESEGEAVIWTLENAFGFGCEYILKFRMLVKLS